MRDEKGRFIKGHVSIGGSKKGRRAWNKGLHIQVNTGRTHFKKGHVPWIKGRKRPLKEETKMKMSIAQKKLVELGIHHMWKGGISDQHRLIRRSYRYKRFKLEILRRDDYTCQICKIRGIQDLQIDHIKSFAYFPELRFDESNIRTICKNCHKKTDTYLVGSRSIYEYVQTAK